VSFDVFLGANARSSEVSKPNKLLLVNTFRHYFIGLGLALSDKTHNYHLVFIHQKFNDERNPIYRMALEMVEPFVSVSCLPVRSSRIIGRIENRKIAFNELKELVISLKPVEIAVGNDVRLEFQYAMNLARNILKLNVEGAFLDDGTGSYVFYVNMRLAKYVFRRWTDKLIKKLTYGLWYTKPASFGSSHWIDICYLCHPALVPASLSEKRCIEMKVDFYQTPQAKIVMKRIANALGIESIPEVLEDSILVALPHSSMIETIYGSLDQAKERISAIINEYEHVYVKYHPAEQLDVLGLEGSATILPSAIPVEFFFSVMSFDKVVGDVSTALMSAKWMLPDCDVCFIDVSSPYTKVVKELFLKMNIKPLPAIEAHAI